MSIQTEILFLFGTLLTSWVLATLAVWYAWEFQDTSGTKLYDLFFQILPDFSYINSPVPNYIVFASAICTLISLEKQHWGYLCQFLLLNSVILLLRSFTTTMTLLPNIYVYDFCKETPKTFFEVVEKQIEYGTCADYMFSGHTAVVFLLYMFTHRHKFNYVFEFVNGLLLGGMVLALLLLRWHYTIDILVAIVIVFLIFKYYKDYEKLGYWFYFPEMKKLNFKCESITKNTPDRQLRTDFTYKRVQTSPI